MKRVLLAAAFAVLIASASVVAVGAQTAPRITVRYASNYANVQPPGRYVDMQMTVTELDPGVIGPANSYTSERYVTVVEGALRVTVGPDSKDYTAGSNFVIPGGVYAKLTNLSTSTKAQIFFSSLRVTGSIPQQVLAPGEVPPAGGIRVLATATLAGVQVPTSGATLQQVVQDWEAGAKNSPHVMNHPHLFVAFGGENTTKYTDGTSLRVTSGQSGVMTPGKPGIMENTGNTTARLYFFWVLTPGTPNTSPVTAAPAATGPTITPPSTGEAGLASTVNGIDTLYVVAAAGALSLLAAVYRQASRRA